MKDKYVAQPSLNYMVEIKGKLDGESYTKTFPHIIAPSDERAKEWGAKQAKQIGVDAPKIVATRVTDEVLAAMKPVEVVEEKEKKPKQKGRSRKN